MIRSIFCGRADAQGTRFRINILVGSENGGEFPDVQDRIFVFSQRGSFTAEAVLLLLNGDADVAGPTAVAHVDRVRAGDVLDNKIVHVTWCTNTALASEMARSPSQIC